jgi:hypothetical protein
VLGLLQFTAGWTQLPETLEKLLPDATYPDQLLLVAAALAADALEAPIAAAALAIVAAMIASRSRLKCI